jgi:gamma-glutamyltranspeptidase/glutathione hydrolase
VRIERVEGHFEPTDDGKCSKALGGMVASAAPAATAAGVEMLAQGGNAIDAACAVGLALGVCEPQGSGLGGQSMGTIHFEGRTFAIDGSSRAPSLAHPSKLTARQLRIGHRATTVPSTPALYAWLSQHYGRLDWATVLEPAIRIARQGYPISELQHRLQTRELDNFIGAPGGSGADYFLNAGSGPHEVGEIFCQPDLAAVLELMAWQGVETFYRGDIAAQIDADMRANDGFLQAEDLAFIPWPIERKVLGRRYRGLQVVSVPPPGTGRTLLLVMMMLNRLHSRFLGTHEPRRYHFMAETLRKAFLQRKERPFDANTYPQIQDKVMLSRDYAATVAGSIADQMDAGLPIRDPRGADLDETTHFNVMDRDGNVVAMTQSIELVYGAKVAAAGLGFLYNNYMQAFERKDPSHPYYLRPNAVPWSTAAPTIVFRHREPWIALGSPGSERIFSTISQFLVNVIDGSATICEAMAEPRFHCSIGGTINLEKERFDPEVVRYLRTLGYRIKAREPFAFYLGCVQAVLKRQTGIGFQGVADVRRDGTAGGID